MLGGAIGVSLAFNLKLKAQLALCQMQIEANTRATLQAMAGARPESGPSKRRGVNYAPAP